MKMDDRILPVSSAETDPHDKSRLFMYSVPSLSSARPPRHVMMSVIRSMSLSRGQLRISMSSRESMLHAMMGSTEFFADGMKISPDRRLPPRT